MPSLNAARILLFKLASQCVAVRSPELVILVARLQFALK